MVNNLINKIEVFGLHFASLDIRQDSSVHGKVLDTLAGKGNDYYLRIMPHLTDEEKIKCYFIDR